MPIMISPRAGQQDVPTEDRVTSLQRVSSDRIVGSSISSIGSGINSFGEVVLRWKLSSLGRPAVETFIIVATFNGTTAPLGAIPVVPGVSLYRFVDHVLNAYVGRKTYRIVLIHVDGSISVGRGEVSRVKEANVKRTVIAPGKLSSRQEQQRPLLLLQSLRSAAIRTTAMTAIAAGKSPSSGKK